MARCSLCLIARDEARFVTACLRSAAPVADDLVVTDTGSSDDTVSLAQAEGARVVHFDWIDDFAAARNACLAEARGDWILLLDADEQLAPGAAAMLEEAMAQNDFDCGELPLYDAQSLDTPAEQLGARPELFKRPVYLKRFFRRTPDLRWEGAIHEHVSSWLEGRRVKRIEAPIVHYGNVPELRQARDKNARNLALLEVEYQRRPNDLKLTAYYLLERARALRDEDTRSLAERAWNMLRAAGPTVRPRYVPVITTHSGFLIEAGRFEEATAVLTEALGWIDHPHLFWQQAVLGERLAASTRGTERARALQLAADAYGACLARDGKPFAAEVTWGATSWMSALGLGRVLAGLGHWQEAGAAFERSLSLIPSDVVRDELQHVGLQARLGSIEALLDGGKIREVMRLLRRDKEIPATEAAVLRADAYERNGNFQSCFEQLEQLLLGEPTFVSSTCQARFRELLSLVNLYRGKAMTGPGTMGSLAALFFELEEPSSGDPVPLDRDRLARVVPRLIELHGHQALGRCHDEAARRRFPELADAVAALIPPSPTG